MEVVFSTDIQQLGRLSGAVLASVFAKVNRNEKEKREFIDMLNELKRAGAAENLVVEKKDKPKSANVRVSKRDICRGVLEKIRSNLSNYEGSDSVDEWGIEFTVGQDYSKMDLNDIKESHKRYVLRSTNSCYSDSLQAVFACACVSVCRASSDNYYSLQCYPAMNI